MSLQREDSFSVPSGGIVPVMTPAEMWDHMRMMDPEAYFHATEDIPFGDRGDQAILCLWLLQHKPFLYAALENILRSFQSAYFVASETRQSIMDGYRHLTFVQSMVVAPEAVEQDLEPEKAKSEKKRKRAPKKKEEKLPADLQEIQTAIIEAVEEKKSRFAVGSEHYYAQERFYEDFALCDYRHFHKKNRTHYQIDEIRGNFEWDTIYHVNGPWDAEMLKDKLKADGRTIIIIKKIRGADSEVMGYKVLEGKKK